LYVIQQLKKTPSAIGAILNIKRLTELFEQVCVFDSNKNVNDARHLHYAKIIAIGCVRKLTLKHETNALNQLQQFYDAKKSWLFGYVTYDLKNELEALHSKNSDQLNFPLLHFFEPGMVIEINEQEILIYFNDEFISEQEVEQVYVACFEPTITSINKTETINIESKISKEEYIEAIEHLKEHIRKGNIYEVNYCQEFFATQAIIDSTVLYEKLNAISHAPFAAYCKFDHHEVMCASPERFIQRIGNRLISQPIKGTIKRSGDKKEDEALKQMLFNDAKERSENVMIVDLVRNDLSRIAKRGTVQVDELFGVYSFQQVHQLISTVSCEIESTTTFTDILKNTFPMGSMTGAPKVSAMQLIEHYEKTKRGLYSGALGYITPTGDFDFNVVIRSILYNTNNNYVSFMVGSAITDKSIPEKEYEECLLKAKAMFEVLTGLE
jgi:para-aminobenzoate synthetase component I